MIRSLNFRALERHELHLVSQLFGTQDATKTPDVLAWEFFDSALCQPGFVIGAFDGPRLIATQAFIPFRAQYKGEMILSAKSELTLVDSNYRGKGIFDQLYEVGFRECRRRGIACVWGFTAATKAFAGAGFQCIPGLWSEFLIWSPARFLRHRRAIPVVDPLRECSQAGNWKEKVNNGPQFSLVKDADYLRYRYVNNPRRSTVLINAQSQTVLSAGGQRPALLAISEYGDLGGALQLWNAKLGNYDGLLRFSNRPSFGLFFVRPSLYYRKASTMEIVFRWLDREATMQSSDFAIEECYTQGVA